MFDLFKHANKQIISKSAVVKTMIDLLMFAILENQMSFLANTLAFLCSLSFILQSTFPFSFKGTNRLASCLLCLTLTLWLLRAIKRTINKHNCHFVHESPHLVGKVPSLLLTLSLSGDLSFTWQDNLPYSFLLLSLIICSFAVRWCQSGAICLLNCHHLSAAVAPFARMITGV